MNLRWDFFVNAYDTSRYLPGTGLDGRENRHIAFVSQFASVVSVLQVCVIYPRILFTKFAL
ncbi:2002_t:CDS:1, partial [Acaulospora colombiana]